jgi:AraC-like DNA-binding protein
MHDFFAHQRQTVDPWAALLGVEQDWTAVVGLFRAPDGFGEEAWIDAIPETLLAVRLAGGTVRCDWGTRRGHESAGSASALQIAGTPNHFTALNAVEFAQIYLPDSLVQPIAESLRDEGCVLSAGLRDDLIFMPDVELDRRALDYVHAARRSATVVEMEARAMLLVERLLLAKPASAAEARRGGGLAPWQLRRARDMMDALDEKVSLTALAAAVSLSPFHFARAFKLSTGLPPHRYQIGRRIERAMAMLAATDLAIADVAAAVGYADHAHFTRMFRQHVGTTPAAFRRERRR